MRKIKPSVLLRAGAFGLFIVIAAVIAVTFISRRRSEVHQKVPENGKNPIDSKLTTVTENFTWRNTEGGKDIYQVAAKKDKAFEDGHHELEGVRLEYYGKNSDRNDVITADHANYDNVKGYADFQNNV